MAGPQCPFFNSALKPSSHLHVTLVFNYPFSLISDATDFSQARFGVGSGPIYLDNVACTGSELVLSDCPYDSHTADCTHHEDAGVRCNCKYHYKQAVLGAHTSDNTWCKVNYC